ncbi:CGNR zinc finger domain-containing protein [Segeticoccus rhizosphaerae]|uniref:CGNR zinc finger domain-containing protein n=1 Tax=Segeticoccus rhizosphaerae TaxID=1104777 RepID=UPI0010C0A756|nr:MULTISPECIES: CGNR zinc finger domain-containing protein [Intrasporangiaceae]
MHFAHDTQEALIAAAALVNTRLGGTDHLRSQADLDAFMVDNPYTGTRLRTEAELAQVRHMREQLRTVWDTPDRDAAAEVVNELLRQVDARPYLTKHGEYDWHVHATEPDDPLAQRIGAEAAMGFVDLIRGDDLDRLKRCAGEDCDAVLVDLSRNRSRRFCDTGNCGNRAHVAAYRARKAHAATA